MFPGTTAPTLVSRTRRDTRGAWGFAIFWNLVSMPLLFIIPKEIERNPLVAIGALFPLVGVGLLVYAARLTARWRQFGEVHFDARGAASPGGVLAGQIHLPHAPSLPNGATGVVRLTCLSRTVDRDGDVHERILWREEADAHIRGGHSATVAVSIPIPADALESTAVDRGAGIYWTLAVDARLPGVDLHELFDVTVQRSAVAAPTASPTPHVTSTGTVVTEADLKRAGIEIGVVDGKSVFRFAAARNPAFAAGLTAFLAIWTAALAFHAFAMQRAEGLFVVFFFIFFLLTAAIELLLLVVTVDLWLGVTVLTIGEGRVHRRYSLLGIPSEKRWLYSEVTAIDLKITSQTSGATGTPYYDVRAALTSGRHATLAPRVRDKRQAEWLAKRLRELVGLTHPS